MKAVIIKFEDWSKVTTELLNKHDISNVFVFHECGNQRGTHKISFQSKQIIKNVESGQNLRKTKVCKVFAHSRRTFVPLFQRCKLNLF